MIWLMMFTSVDPGILPAFQFVHDLFRRAGDLLGLGAVSGQVTDGRFAAGHGGNRRLKNALGTLGLDLAQRGVERQAAEIDANPAADMRDDRVRSRYSSYSACLRATSASVLPITKDSPPKILTSPAARPAAASRARIEAVCFLT